MFYPWHVPGLVDCAFQALLGLDGGSGVTVVHMAHPSPDRNDFATGSVVI